MRSERLKKEIALARLEALRPPIFCCPSCKLPARHFVHGIGSDVGFYLCAVKRSIDSNARQSKLGASR